ncbi:hypothetical protein ONZ51_g5119 [Trametes cubensis]|uniref:Uncharacterized protein n=1 Tax=Trametes cubensis TaxID=1111947 RepID=A0AAD7XBT7_9APHY|nr:hypothetical protein ONZ51_g5119 [Trametes cubensis]
MSDLAFNVWGAITGVLGTIALIPVFLAWLQTRLPSTRLPQLLALLKETRELFAAAVRDGLFTDEKELHQFNINLWGTVAYVDDVRARVYAARTWRQDVNNWWHGLSGRITTLCEELDVIRLKLARRNSNERKKIASQGLPTELPLMTDDTGLRYLSSARYGCTPPPYSHPPPSCPTSHSMGLSDTSVPQSVNACPCAPAQFHCQLHGAHAPVQVPFPAATENHPVTPEAISSLLNRRLADDPSSDAVLRELLLLALSRLDKKMKGGTWGTQSLGGNGNVEHPSDLWPRASHCGVRAARTTIRSDVRRTVVRALKRVIRHIYGAPLRGAGKTTASHVLLDSESLMPLASAESAHTSGRDNDDWEDA